MLRSDRDIDWASWPESRHKAHSRTLLMARLPRGDGGGEGTLAPQETTAWVSRP